MFFPNTARRDFRGTRVQVEFRLTITRLFSELKKIFTEIILAFVKTTATLNFGFYVGVNIAKSVCPYERWDNRLLYKQRSLFQQGAMPAVTLTNAYIFIPVEKMVY